MGAGAERAQWAMQRGGGVLSKGASQAVARRGDHCEVDRASVMQRDHRFESCCDHHRSKVMAFLLVCRVEQQAERSLRVILNLADAEHLCDASVTDIAL